MKILFLTLSLVLTQSTFALERVRMAGPLGTRIVGQNDAPRDSQCGPVAAKTLLQVCNAYKTQEGYVGCLKAGKDAEFDLCALGFCNTYTTEAGCTACIYAIRNKKYTIDELKACNGLSEEKYATECMKTLGTCTKAPLLNEIKYEIKKALHFLDEYELEDAKHTLLKLLDKISK